MIVAIPSNPSSDGRCKHKICLNQSGHTQMKWKQYHHFQLRVGYNNYIMENCRKKYNKLQLVFFNFLKLFWSWMFQKLASEVCINLDQFVSYGFKIKAINLYKTNKPHPNLSDCSASCMTGSFVMEAWIMFLSHLFCWEWFTAQRQDGLISKKEALLNWMIN